jgi:hypothetical protein
MGLGLAQDLGEVARHLEAYAKPLENMIKN